MMNYKTGGKKVVMPEQAKIVDPRSEKVLEDKTKLLKVTAIQLKELVLQENKKTLLGINPWRFQY